MGFTYGTGWTLSGVAGNSISRSNSSSNSSRKVEVRMPPGDAMTVLPPPSYQYLCASFNLANLTGGKGIIFIMGEGGGTSSLTASCTYTMLIGTPFLSSRYICDCPDGTFGHFLSTTY